LVVGESRRLRVLVVEDEPDFAIQLTRILQKYFSAEVTLAPDIQSAREQINQGEFEIVTLDYQLPDGDGLSMIAEITGGLDNPPPVILVTGHGDEQTAETAFQLGATGYVVKDERLPAMLTEAVRNALAGSGL
jgi:DNA-binding response OmpR family regulator